MRVRFISSAVRSALRDILFLQMLIVAAMAIHTCGIAGQPATAQAHADRTPGARR